MRKTVCLLCAAMAAVAMGESTRALRLAGLRAIPGGIVYARHAILGGSHYAYTEALSDAQSERTFIPGGALCRMTFGADGEPQEEVLLNAGEGGSSATRMSRWTGNGCCSLGRRATGATISICTRWSSRHGR